MSPEGNKMLSDVDSSCMAAADLSTLSQSPPLLAEPVGARRGGASFVAGVMGEKQSKQKRVAARPGRMLPRQNNSTTTSE